MNGVITSTPLRFLDTPHLTLILKLEYLFGIAPSIHTITYGGGRASSPLLYCVPAIIGGYFCPFLFVLYYKKKASPEHSIITKVWVYTGNRDRIFENSFLFCFNLSRMAEHWASSQGFELSSCCTTTQTGVFPFLAHTHKTVDG